MGRKLPLAVIERELSQKNLKLVSDYEDYKNINSLIVVECIEGHKIHTTLESTRSPNFTCSICVGDASVADHVSTKKVPPKKGQRIVGFDNATHNMGVAIFDDGKLVYYNLLQFTSGSAIQRLNKIRDLLEEEIFPIWKPDIVQIEGIQHQNSYRTYEVLIKLHGLFEMAADRFGVQLESDRSNQWRSHHNINKRNRAADKRAAIQKVKEMYNIDVGDDIAEAILITKYRVDLEGRQELVDLF